MMPISYRIIKGSAIKHWVIISGGVTIAARIKITTIASLLLDDKSLGVTIPSLVRNNAAKGSWKMIPKTSVKTPKNDIYLSMLIIGATRSVAKFNRNAIPIGTIIKYPKPAPSTNRMKENGPKIRVYLFSASFSPDLINCQI